MTAGGEKHLSSPEVVVVEEEEKEAEEDYYGAPKLLLLLTIRHQKNPQYLLSFQVRPENV